MHAGVFNEKYECSICEQNAKMRDVWGCEKDTKLSIPTFEENENGEYLLYKRCPVRYIPKSVHEFFRIYWYYNKFTSAPMPEYTEISRRFYLAANYYERKLSENLKEVRKNV